MQKFHKNKLPKVFNKIFTKLSTHKYKTRQSNSEHFLIPRVSKKKTQCSLKYVGA